jgi:hypothetical protein
MTADPRSTRARLWHAAYMTCPDVDLPEPNRSLALLRRMRKYVSIADPDFQHFVNMLLDGRPLADPAVID